MGEHLADGFDADTLAECPRCKGMSSDVHCEIDVNFCHVSNQLQIFVALLVAHKIQTVVVLAQDAHCLRKKDNGIRNVGLQSLVLDAVIVALLYYVLLADFDEIRVG